MKLKFHPFFNKDHFNLGADLHIAWGFKKDHDTYIDFYLGLGFFGFTSSVIIK